MAQQASILSSFPRRGRRERGQPGTCRQALEQPGLTLQEQQFPHSSLGLAREKLQECRHSSLLVFSAPQATSLPLPAPLPKLAVSLPPQAGPEPGITPAPGAALTASLPPLHLPTRKVLVNKASVPQPRVHQQLGAQLDYVQPGSPGHFSIKHQIKHRIPPTSLPREVSLSPSL